MLYFLTESVGLQVVHGHGGGGGGSHSVGNAAVCSPSAAAPHSSVCLQPPCSDAVHVPPEI